MTKYNYPEIIQWLEQKGNQNYGDNFKIVEDDIPIITTLLVYFLNDEIMAKTIEIDLNKGILLSGPIGCGKTSLMNLMRYVPEQERKFILKPTREISFEFIKEGYDVIQRYSSGNKLQSGIKNYCFDDLGTENNLKYFGNECNVIGEILLSRYDLFINKKIITHITTNLSASEIEAAYGNRVRSRLRQMLNLIAFNPITKDKR
ncbi:MAG: ATPase [Flavobacterium sp.]|nr:MAG: ATPase [Flavobacterium sp.]